MKISLNELRKIIRSVINEERSHRHTSGPRKSLRGVKGKLVTNIDVPKGYEVRDFGSEENANHWLSDNKGRRNIFSMQNLGDGRIMMRKGRNSDID